MKKKKYAPKKKPPRLSKASLQLKSLYERLLKKEEKAGSGEEKQYIKKYKLMIDLANKGVNIAEILRVIAHIPLIWQKRTGTLDMTMDLSGGEYSKYFNKTERPVLNAFNLLTQKIPAVFQDCVQAVDINREIIKMQSELKKYEWVIEEYFKLRRYELCFEALRKSCFGSLRDTGNSVEKNIWLASIRKLISPDKLKKMLLKKNKPARQSSHGLWVEAKLTIMNELGDKIGYSEKQSQKITADLLNLFYPAIYKDKDPDLIRSTCSHHK